MAGSMDNFTLFLLIGMGALLVGLLAVTALDSGFSGGTLEPGGRVVTSATGEVFAVGPEDVDTFVPYHMDFNVSNLNSAATRDLGSSRVFSGVLFGSDSLRYRITSEKLETMKIMFTVAKTNTYGALVVRVNGKDIARSALPAGDYSFNIEKELLAPETDLEIFAESSSWKIWAPTVYELSSVRVEANAFSERSFVFKFDLTGKYETFRRGKINLNLLENKGSLAMTLNGKEIYNDIPGNTQNVEFYGESVKDGTNTLEFRASPSSSFVGNGVLAVTYTAKQENKIAQYFNVTNGTFGLGAFGGGSVRFDVVDVSKPGGMAVKIVGDKGTTFSSFENAAAGLRNYQLNKTSVSPGRNTLLIESVDGAVFTIRAIRISV
ncbi:MAG: hypothetical protein HY365_03480 [Candidatus Aenigmarchaeota archaeon]|nr:hypothetical protein [Candidatus Aenigmarchaeota archaeon]